MRLLRAPKPAVIAAPFMPAAQFLLSGNTGETLAPADLRTLLYMPPHAPSVTRRSPWTRFAIRGARVVAEHGQNAPVDSVESGQAVAGVTGATLSALLA